MKGPHSSLITSVQDKQHGASSNNDGISTGENEGHNSLDMILHLLRFIENEKLKEMKMCDDNVSSALI